MACSANNVLEMTYAFDVNEALKAILPSHGKTSYMDILAKMSLPIQARQHRLKNLRDLHAVPAVITIREHIDLISNTKSWEKNSFPSLYSVKLSLQLQGLSSSPV